MDQATVNTTINSMVESVSREKVRLMSYNSYREIVKHHLPGIQLQKTNNGKCNQTPVLYWEFMSVNLEIGAMLYLSKLRPTSKRP